MEQPPLKGAATWESKVRGLMLGLALGDAIGKKASDVPPDGPLLAGAATQLAAFTAESIIRTNVRGNHHQASPGVIWMFGEAYLRWAAIQGYNPEKLQTHSHWYLPEERTLLDPDRVGWPEGWLSRVPAMKEKRGTSPSTVKALLAGRPVESAGCQALLRSLPIAAWNVGPSMAPSEIAYHAAGITHSGAGAPTSMAVGYLTECLRGQGVPGARAGAGLPFDSDSSLGQSAWNVAGTATSTPCIPDLLAQFAPDRTAWSAFKGGLYTVLSIPDQDTVMEALEFAAWAPDGDSVAAVAGAILGSVHGFEVFPVDLISRLELGWVVDSLARDLVLELRENQGGSDWDEAIDPRWWARYPGY